MTAGIATARLTAVATSASEMPAITVLYFSALRARNAEVPEGLDDAEHRAEQADERGVAAERAGGSTEPS